MLDLENACKVSEFEVNQGVGTLYSLLLKICVSKLISGNVRCGGAFMVVINRSYSYAIIKLLAL